MKSSVKRDSAVFLENAQPQNPEACSKEDPEACSKEDLEACSKDGDSRSGEETLKEENPTKKLYSFPLSELQVQSLIVHLSCITGMRLQSNQF